MNLFKLSQFSILFHSSEKETPKSSKEKTAMNEFKIKMPITETHDTIKDQLGSTTQKLSPRIRTINGSNSNATTSIETETMPKLS